MSTNSTDSSISNEETDKMKIYYMFHYSPSISLAYVGIAVFAVLTAFLIFRIRRLNAPAFMMKVPTLAILELVGFVLRYEVIKNPSTGTYTGMTVLLLISANLLSVTNYNCLVHIIKLAKVQSEKFYYQPDLLSKILSISTLGTSILQAAGSGMLSNTSTRTAGFALVFLGLVLQFLVFMAYFVILNYVQRNRKFDYVVYGQHNPKQNLIYLLYITTSVLLIRNVYRIVQYGFTVNNEIVPVEWPFYIFDALMVAICFAVFGIIPLFFPTETKDVIEDGSGHTHEQANQQSRPNQLYSLNEPERVHSYPRSQLHQYEPEQINAYVPKQPYPCKPEESFSYSPAPPYSGKPDERN